MKWPFSRNINMRARDKPEKEKPKSTALLRPVTKRRADTLMQNSEAIYAAVSRIANAMATMPVHMYKECELQTAHPAEQLLAYAPNDNMTAFTFVQTMEVYRNIEGRAYALKVTDSMGALKRLDILDPAFVVPRRHPETGEMWYYVTLDDGAMYYPVPGCQMIVLRHMSANGENGIRPVDVLRGTLDYDKDVKEYSLKQLNGVNSGVFLTVPNSALGGTERQRVIDQFLDAYENSGGRVVVLEGGLQATTFSNPPISAQVLDVERITRNRVATVYNIPPNLLGDYSDSSFATAEQQMMEFLQLTITPIVVQWEAELNRKLLTPAEWRQGYHFTFDTDALTRADAATTADVNQKAIRGGWRKPNEVRKREHRPPDPCGDELMASRDLLPLRVSVQTPELLLGSKATEEGGKKTE